MLTLDQLDDAPARTAAEHSLTTALGFDISCQHAWVKKKVPRLGWGPDQLGQDKGEWGRG